MLDLFLVQLESVSSNDPFCKTKNFAKVRDLLQKKGVEPSENGGKKKLILLPEMFATGYIPRNPSAFAEDFTLASANVQKESSENNATVDFLQSLASEYNALVLGTGIHKVADGFTNHLGIFTPNGCGEVLSYDKVHPFFPEISRQFIAGKSVNLYKVGPWAIASVICYDLRFPELFRQAVAAGANLITVHAAWPLIRKEHWVTLLKARAIENQVYIVAVNGVSPSEENPEKRLAGTSMIIDPWGNVIAEASESVEEVVCGTVSLEPLLKYRQDFPVLLGIAP